MECFTLENGIRVVFEKIEYVKSVTMGVFVGSGSFFETKENNGVSHFLEHMFFKGTKNKSAKEIAEFMDSIGGQLNAYTTKEYTCFYAKVLSEYTEKAMDILSDMLINSTFTDENINLEKKVICEEIKINDDTPEELIFDLISKQVWQNSPLGMPVAGTVESVMNIKRRDILDYYNKHYVGENIVISIVGNFNFEELKDLLEKYFSNGFSKIYTRPQITELPSDCGSLIERKNIKQCQLCISFDALEKGHELMSDLIVLNSVFGGNVSSRLFQKIREENGLSYSVYSFLENYKTRGALMIYAGLNTDELDKVIYLINNEISRLKTEKLNQNEIELAKTQLRSEFVMGLESLSNRMSSYGKGLLLNNKIKSADDVLRKIDAVSSDKIAYLIDLIFDKDKLNIAVLGKVKNNDYRKEILA